MSDVVASFGDVGSVIQLALTPAFLLTGIAGLLNVMTGRLARIIDRGRQLEEKSRESGSDILNPSHIEIGYLEARRYLASSAITFCTLSALLVCMVIGSLFVKAMFGLEAEWVIGSLFSLSTLALVIGLAYFLREVHLATKSVRILLPGCDKKK